MKKNIKELIDVSYDFMVTGVTDDSRNVKSGFIFVATKGYNVDHFDYISDAIERGCSFLVVDRKLDIDFPHILVENISSFYQNLCIKFYDVNLSNLQMIGLTGTDGKTTTATIVHDLIEDCCYIGTNGLMIDDKTYDTNNTTPCISELYQDLRKIQDAHKSRVVMEVSSEALLHNRVEPLSFDIIGFTNITGDHLNVHGSFENYVNAKMKLLNFVKENGKVIVNGDDDILQSIQCPNMYTFGFRLENDFVIRSVRRYKQYTRITLYGNHKKYILKSPFIGKHNVYNVVMAFVIGLFFGIEESLLLERISTLKSIPGRCEFLNFGQDYDIVLDYAHTIQGIRTILDTFSNYSNIITVTGCAGGREKKKRSIIGKLVMDNSNISIFTMDDPRWENVDDIIDEMVGDRKDYIRILDRQKAIFYALSIAKAGSVVLILGKGRDHYMAIGDKKEKYCDYEVIESYFK